jgi:four helix bundle protein
VATFRSFEEIEAWQKARELSNAIYAITLTGTFSKDYGLKDQINRSSGSVMDNIAEGFERGENKDFIHLLSSAMAAVGEVSISSY